MARFATYDGSTATKRGRWSRRVRRSEWACWSPDLSIFAPPRPVTFFKHFGARHNEADLGMGTSTIAQMLTDELGSYIVSYDATPGGFYVPGAQAPDAVFFPDGVQDDIEALRYFASRPTDTSIWDLQGAVAGSCTTNRRLKLHWGPSSGGFDVAHCQLTPDLDLEYADGPTRSGDARWAQKASHECGVMLTSQAQFLLSSFCAVRSSSPAPSGYTVSGAHSIGATALTLTGGTGQIYQGNVLVIGAKRYSARLDAVAGVVQVYPTIETALAGGETVDVVFDTDPANSDLSKYWPYGWAGSYIERNRPGVTWAGIDMERKIQLDVDRLITADNPRAKDLCVVLVGASANRLVTASINGADPKSFLNHVAPGVVEPSYIDLHSEHQSFLVAYLLDLIGNTNVHLYQGSPGSNPGPYAGAGGPAWNKGVNNSFAAAATSVVISAQGGGVNTYTITSGASTWASLGFVVGMEVWTEGWANAANRGAKNVTNIVGTVMTVSQALVTEAAGPSVSFRYNALKAILLGQGW